MIKIKVNGITKLEDAIDAISLGADAIGFFFYDCAWQIDLQDAKDIALRLPPFITRVGIFKDEDPELVNTIVSSTGMDVIQLNGNESVDYCCKLNARIIKYFHLSHKKSFKQIDEYREVVSALLLDTYSEQVSDNCKSFDWGLVTQARDFEIPIMINCDLQQTDIAKAIKTVKPEMIELNTIIEKSPGIKDYNKLQDIMKFLQKEI